MEERPSVFIIGAGMAGLVAALELQDQFRVVVVDKGRGVGGRMATRRIGDATFDHGAQFLTTHSQEFADLIQRLTDQGAVTPWYRGQVGPKGALQSDGHIRFRGVQSMNSIAKQLATNVEVRTSTLITALSPESGAWAITVDGEDVLRADAVIATAPVPQTLALFENGATQLAHEDQIALEAIAYDPCLALMACLDGPPGLPEPGAVDPDTGPIDWMADNQRKGISLLPGVTIHATAEFSRSNWDSPDESIAEELLASANLQANTINGTLQIQRWRYARPSVEHPERFLSLQNLPPLVCAGDAFGEAKVEGAALSGRAAAQQITRLFGGMQ